MKINPELFGSSGFFSYLCIVINQLKNTTMNYQEIKKLQKEYGFAELQENINSGLVWKLEGFVGRTAMEALESGACMLPKVPRYDAYGNKVPSRGVLKSGTKGTYQNSQTFWTKVVNGDIDL